MGHFQAPDVQYTFATSTTRSQEACRVEENFKKTFLKGRPAIQWQVVVRIVGSVRIIFGKAAQNLS
jgi:hypothetical protein